MQDEIEEWHVLLWCRNMVESHKIREGDIVDVIPAKQWDMTENETRLCVILPVVGINKAQAKCLKNPGSFIKRQYRISFDDLNKYYNLSMSDIRDERKQYQPFLDQGIVINLVNSRFVTDKQNNVVEMSSIQLRI